MCEFGLEFSKPGTPLNLEVWKCNIVEIDMNHQVHYGQLSKTKLMSEMHKIHRHINSFKIHRHINRVVSRPVSSVG